jgi:hypothetical protein
VIDALTLRNRLIYRLGAAGFKTDTQTVDYWYAIAKALLWDWGGNEDSYEVKATEEDITHGPLIEELVGNGTAGQNLGGSIIDIITSLGKPFVRVSSPIFFTEQTRPAGIGSPGDANDPTTIKGTHDHPGEETAGGFRFFTGAYPAQTLDLFAYITASSPDSYVMNPAAGGAWELAGECLSQGGYLGPYAG